MTRRAREIISRYARPHSLVKYRGWGNAKPKREPVNAHDLYPTLIPFLYRPAFMNAQTN